MNSWINFDALWRIVVVGLICGAGLPAVFAIGLRVLALRPTSTDDDRVYTGNPVGAVVAAACFLIVLAGIAWGVYMIKYG